MLARRYPILGSSQDTTKISLTLKSLIPLILLVLGVFKLDIPEIEVETIILTVGAIANGCVTLYGIIRKYIK